MSWQQFTWIRGGESSGNREGYTPDVFLDMNNEEINKAREYLIKDDLSSDVFALEGLTYLDPITAEKIIDSYIIDSPENIYKKMHIYALKDYVTKQFNHSSFTLNQINSADEKIHIEAISNLKIVSKFLSSDAKKIIIDFIINSEDISRRVRACELIKTSNLKNSDLSKFTIEIAREKVREKRKVLIDKYQLL